MLLLQDDSAIIQVKDEMPEGSGNKFSISLPPSCSVQELYTTVMRGRNYSPESCELVFSNNSTQFEVTRDDDQSLLDAGLSFGVTSKNTLKIVPRKAKTPPSIVISLANKGEENSDSPEDSSPSNSVSEVSSKFSNRSDSRHRHRRSHQDRYSILSRHKLPNSQSSSSQNKWNIGYVGLVNQAMTCYLNSLLQALFMTPEFRNSLYKWEFIGSPEETNKSIPFQLQKLFLSLQTSSRSAVETSKLTRSFGWDASDSWQQHDIQELCRVMFDALEQRFKDTDQADFINNLYQGKLIDYVTCLECKTEKKRVDTFLDIPLPVRPFGSTVAYNSVAEAMHAFIQPETLDGNNQYFCETCNKKCDAHKGLKFSHFPYILTLHLKRFDFDYNAMTRIKLTDRVQFPHILNINEYLCGEAKNSLNKAANSGLEGPPSPINDDESSDRSAKGDDLSTADSGSIMEDEGCHGSGIMHESTTGSNSSGSNGDMQDYDEGIDLNNGTSNRDENEKNRRHTQECGSPGPYVYELFAIMIHSGSASGGHYYVYIKDFEKSEWFCFDDQSVSRITNEDISMTFGGGSHRAYYSGAHSSSTNAYMLMYRQIDKKRNQAAMAVDDFPPHIQELVKKMQMEEEVEQILCEREKDRLRIKVFTQKPKEMNISEAKLVIDGDTTLSEATAIAYKLFSLDNLVTLEQCRLVSYDFINEALGVSFDGQDGEPMSSIYSSIQNLCFQSLYLEIREPDAQFEPYRPGAVGFKVYRVDTDTKQVGLPIEVRVNESLSFVDLRQKVAKALKLTSIIIIVEEYGNGLLELQEETFQEDHFFCDNKVFVAELSELEPKADFINELNGIIEGFRNTISLYCTLPDTDKESLAKLGITPLSTSDQSKSLNKQHEAMSDSVFVSSANKCVSRGTSPQLPPLEGEEECLGATGWSDQSTSEDSSLTDSDRTIVGDEADYCLAELSSASDSPVGSERPSVSSPRDKEKEPLPFVKMKKEEKVNNIEKVQYDEDSNKLLKASDNEELWDDNQYKLKIFPYKTQEQDNLTVVRIHVDKRMTLGAFRASLGQHIGVSSESIKLFRVPPIRKNDRIPYSSLQEPLTSLRDEEHIVVRLERALKKGEYQGKVYQLIADDGPIKFLCDWIVAKDMLVGEAKKQILDDLKVKQELEIPYDRCRLRAKKWKDPGKIFLDSQSFEDLHFAPNWEIFLQELNEPENVTMPSQVTIFLKRFSNTGRLLDDFHEVTLGTPSLSELRELLSDITNTPLDSLQLARPSANFPRQLQTRQASRELKWDLDCHCNLEDGVVLYYRNKDDDGTSDSSATILTDSGKVRYLAKKKRSKDEISSNSKACLNRDSYTVNQLEDYMKTRKSQGKALKIADADPDHQDQKETSLINRKRQGKALRIVVSPTESQKTTEDEPGVSD